MTEPARQTDLNLLDPIMKKKVSVFLVAAKYVGLKVTPFETLRTKERQKYLYSIGRTINIGSKPVTWTMDSLHLGGHAVDFIFTDNKNPRSGNRQLFRDTAEHCGLQKIPQESCHVQDDYKTIEQTIGKNSELWNKTTEPRQKDLLHFINEELRK